MEAARGSLRETLSALRNLEQLLKSIRVGPRALSSVIPDVHSSCQSLSNTISSLLGSVAGRIADASPTQELEAFALPRAKELVDALGKARRKTLTAKKRLDLERIVAAKTNELDAVRALAECLDEAASGRQVHIDLSQLAQQALAAGGEAAGPRAHIGLSAERLGEELSVNPKVATQLIVLCASAVTDGGQRPAQLSIAKVPQGGCELRLRGLEHAPTGAYTVGLPAKIPPSATCLNAVAALTRAELSQTGGELVLRWSAESTRASG
ncbi:MAG: hypothetical protein KC766_37640 [Myxococcales bacterium]|nr:hypothetical protein [Myxococcales bacterium]